MMEGASGLLINRFKEFELGLRFVAGVIPFLRHSLTGEAAASEVQWRLRSRETLLLQCLRDRVFSSPGSPHHALLSRVGCEEGDLQHLVRTQGVEGALQALFRNGVYLTVDEFKGRTPIVRGNMTFSALPDQFQKLAPAARLGIRTSSGRSGGSAMPVDFAYIQSQAANLRLDLTARGGLEWHHAIWGIPGGSAMVHLLEYSGAGARPVRWFSHVNPASSDLALRYRWSARALCMASRFARRPLPRLEHATVEDPSTVLGWITQVLGGGGTPHLLTYTSPAVRLCQVAAHSGVSLSGLQMTLIGEPLTALRLEIICRSGAVAVPRYGSTESGSIGYGCLRAEVPDEVHFLSDRLAMIPADGGNGCPAGSLLVTTLLPSSPFLLLNVSLGDRAILTERNCGCPLQSYGWIHHIQNVRSFEKLTLGGMTFLNTDISRIMDELLPRRFGGEPTHYQLVEEEDCDGRPRLRLLIHPAVGEVDSQEVTEAFLHAISQGHGVERMMGSVWRDAGVIEVERTMPMTTASGKIHHFLAADARKEKNSHV